MLTDSRRNGQERHACYANIDSAHFSAHRNLLLENHRTTTSRGVSAPKRPETGRTRPVRKWATLVAAALFDYYSDWRYFVSARIKSLGGIQRPPLLGFEMPPTHFADTRGPLLMGVANLDPVRLWTRSFRYRLNAGGIQPSLLSEQISPKTHHLRDSLPRLARAPGGVSRWRSTGIKQEHRP